MNFTQTIVHYSLHFLLPVVVAFAFFRTHWKATALHFLLTMMVDLDHLFATPVFDAFRCRIGFHFLHSYLAIGIYALLVFFKRLRTLAIGLLMHMATDYLDCVFIQHNCH